MSYETSEIRKPYFDIRPLAYLLIFSIVACAGNAENRKARAEGIAVTYSPPAEEFSELIGPIYISATDDRSDREILGENLAKINIPPEIQKNEDVVGIFSAAMKDRLVSGGASVKNTEKQSAITMDISVLAFKLYFNLGRWSSRIAFTATFTSREKILCKRTVDKRAQQFNSYGYASAQKAINAAFEGAINELDLHDCPGVGDELSASVPLPPVGDRPWLTREDGSLFVTGLPRNMVSLVPQGALFAVQRPIGDTGDMEFVAVLDVVEEAVPGSGTVPVAMLCQSLRDRERELVGLTIEPLSPTKRPSIGQCLARVVEVSRKNHRQPYVILDVGSHHGLVPGDVYAILGRPVVSEGYGPLGLDTRLDGRCQISGEPGELRGTTSRCVLIKRPNVEGSLHGRFVVFQNRSP